jgi:3-oxoacyl-[acyl-carrier protein] reductase
MDLGLKDKVVVVLASSRGLGRAAAEGFAAEGARVVIMGRHGDALKETARQLSEATGNQVMHQRCDIMEEGALELRLGMVAQELGGVDVLVNNSGGPRAGSFDEMDDKAWRDAFELTVMSYVRAIRIVLPGMRAKGGGRIVNLASTSTRQPIDGLLLSNVFRAGVGGLTKTLSNELAADNILVNVIAPGRIATDRLRELDEGAAKKRGISLEEVQKTWQGRIPLGRYGEPDELARAVVWLGSWANTYVTGQLLCVDGGLVRSI